MSDAAKKFRQDSKEDRNMLRVALSMLLGLSVLAGFAAETKVEMLGEGLWHVRVSRDGTWKEGLLNRFGVIKKMPVVSTSDRMALGFVNPSVKLTEKGFELRFLLAKGERVYGLGDANRDCLERRGRSYDMWVANITSYIPIPMVMTSRGWGVLVNVPQRHTFDIGKTDPDEMVVTAKEGDVDFYVFCGKDYRAMLDTYTQLTGRPALLPAFAYGFAYVANQWVDMFGFTEEAYRFRSLDLPCDIVGLEPGWMEYFYDSSTKKSWNSARFSFPYWVKPKDHRYSWIGALERMGFKLSLWLCMNYDLFVFEEACADGRATVESGVGRQTKEDTEATDVFIDEHISGKFSDKAAEEEAKLARTSDMATSLMRQPIWRPDELTGRKQDGKEAWFKHLTKFVDRGARCFKLDASEQVRDHKGRLWAGKYQNDEVHNLYSIVYDKQMSEGFETYTGNRSMVYSAGGYIGVQRYVATWAGDTGGGVRPLVSVLNLAMSGHPNQGCDMAIFDSRSVHFGIFAPWSQQNNYDSFRQPWYQDAEGLEMLRNYIHLRYRLFPYLYGTGAVAARTGWPIMRPLALVYPEVEEYANEVGTYMLGDALLVSAFVDYVKIPEGTWYEWRTGKAEVGPKTLPVEVTPMWGGALYVKAGSIIPMWPKKLHLDRGWNDVVELHVWPGADGQAELYEDDGDSLAYRTGASAITPLSLKDGTLTIGAREGSFKGMPEVRDFAVRFHMANEPKSVTRDGKPVEGVWCAADKTFTVEIGAVDSAPHTIKFKP